jgi:hypothetical protein
MRTTASLVVLLPLFLLTTLPRASAQAPPGPRPPEFVSPEVSAEKMIAFRVHAPKAELVKLYSSDIPGPEEVWT